MKHQRAILGLTLGLALLAVPGATSARAQDTNATLSGTVTDAGGAAIPNAHLVLTNPVTKAQMTLETDESGSYNFQNLVPGKYNLTATATGFSTQQQNEIALDTAQRGHADIKLAIGQTQDVVEVTAEASTINYTDSTLGGTVAPETLQSFPLVVSGAPRSSVSVATMMPGVTTAGGGNAFNARINGGIISGDEAIVDGATTMEGYMNQSGMVALQTDFGMSPDITSEVTVLSANYPAQYGNTTSGQLIITTKSGGEQFHGAVFEYLRNDALNARRWGLPTSVRNPTDKENDYGGNIGGPMLLPGLHGNSSFLKGYFYFNYEGFKESGGANPSTISIPSLNARNGNFSAIAKQLYYPNDPAKYGALAGQPIAYNGTKNVINPIYQDSVAKSFLNALPTPTNAGEFNNYFIPHAGQGSLTNSENVYFGRFDVTVGKADHVYYTSWWQRTGINTQSDLPVAVSTAQPADPENANIQRLNWEHTFSSSITNHATLGYLNRNEGYYALNGRSGLGTVPGVANSTYLPQINLFGGYQQQLGLNLPPDSSQTKTTRGTYAFNDVVSYVRGKHTMTAGFEYRLAGTAIHLGSNQGGTFQFQDDTTGGSAGASFYLGAVAQGTAAYYNVHAVYPRQPAYAAHFGDSWKVTPKFNVDYSMRWDFISPFREKYNNLTFFDPNGSNPGAVTAAGVQLKGRLAYAGTGYGAASYGAPYPERPFYNAFAPRLGFAYTLNEKTVIRAGYGIYFGQAFYPGWSGGMSQDGLNKSLTLSETASGNSQIPALYLQSGISAAQRGNTAPTISSTFDNGLTPSLYRPEDGNHRPYSSQWNLTVERQLPSSIALSVSYVGTKGTHLPSALSPINVLNPYNQNISRIGTDLTTNYNSPGGPATFAKYGVAVPFVGWQNSLISCQPTIAQALTPYPQYCGTLQPLNEFHATSIYNSLQVRAERRFTRGLYLLSSLTVARFLTDASDTTQATNTIGAGNQGNNGAFSPYDQSGRRFAIAPDNVPVTLQVSVVYDLPFGHGKQFLNSAGTWSDRLISGFQVSPLYRYEYGTPFSFYASAGTAGCVTSAIAPQFRQQCIPTVNESAAYSQGRNGFNPRNGPLFNVGAFQTSFPFGNVGNGPAVTSLYGPSYINTDLAITKNTKVTERVNFRLSANMFNTFNQHAFIASQGGNFGGPSVAFNTDVTQTNFGQWNGNVSTPRTIQFAGRIEF